MEIDEVVNQFLVDCEIRGLTDEAIKWYKNRLGLFARKLEERFNVTELESVNIALLRQFVHLMLNTNADANNPRKPAQDKLLSAFTVRGYVRAIKKFFHWCYDEELLSGNPAARLVQPKAPEYLIPTFTPEHIEKMLSACDTSTDEGFRNYVLLLVLLDTGMRRAELCGLKVEDVHDRYVKVFGKGRKEREIGLHPEVGKLLWKYIHKYRKPADPSETALFIGRTGKPLRAEGVSAILDSIKRKTGLEGVRVSAHTFRHTFGTTYLERGGEIFKLSREMGHSTVQVTEGYLKSFRSKEARREHTSYSPIGEINLPQKRRSRDPEGNG